VFKWINLLDESHKIVYRSVRIKEDFRQLGQKKSLARRKIRNGHTPHVSHLNLCVEFSFSLSSYSKANECKQKFIIVKAIISRKRKTAMKFRELERKAKITSGPK